MTCENNDHDWILEADSGALSLLCAVPDCVYIDWRGEPTHTDGEVLVEDHVDHIVAAIPVHLRITSQHDPWYREFEEDIELRVRRDGEEPEFIDDRCDCCGLKDSFACTCVYCVAVHTDDPWLVNVDGDMDKAWPYYREHARICDGSHRWLLTGNGENNWAVRCENCPVSNDHLFTAETPEWLEELMMRPIPVTVNVKDLTTPVSQAWGGVEVIDRWLEVTVKEENA